MTADALQPYAKSRQSMDLTQAVNLSLRAFVAGLFAILPAVGLISGTYALICWARLRTAYSPKWNPASRYLLIGVAFAVFGLLSHLFLVLSIVVASY